MACNRGLKLSKCGQSARLWKKLCGKIVLSVCPQDVRQRALHDQFAIVVDQAEALEFVHKEVHARSRCSDHFGENGGLGELWTLFYLPDVARSQSQLKSRQAPFSGMEMLVDKVFHEVRISMHYISNVELGEFRAEYPARAASLRFRFVRPYTVSEQQQRLHFGPYQCLFFAVLGMICQIKWLLWR
jgi:hypothetical protein